MSKILRLELNRAGVGELLRSQAVADHLMGLAGSVSTTAGDGYEVLQGFDRVSVLVATGTEAAKQDNLENNTLLKATGRQEG